MQELQKAMAAASGGMRAQSLRLRLVGENVANADTPGRAAGLASDQIVEHVRRRIGFHIVAKLTDREGKLPLVQLSPQWEALFAEHEREEDGRPDVVLPPDEFNRLARAVGNALAEAARAGAYPAIVTSVRRRRFLRQVLEAKGILNPVLSFEEIGHRAAITLVGTA
jgi:flagellar biosynthesis protein FlhA